MQKSTLSRMYKASFPVASILVGLSVGVFAFFHQSSKQEDQVQKFFRASIWGLSTTYVVLSVGVNLKIAKSRKSK